MEEWLASVVQTWGYLGLALAVFLTNATLFVGIPTPTYIILAVALGMDPLLVTLVSGIASAAGETTGYIIGLTGRKALERKGGKNYIVRWQKTFSKYGFFAIVLIAALPFPPDDIAGILAGAVGYEYWKFFLATFIGKIVKYGATAYLTVLGIQAASWLGYG